MMTPEERVARTARVGMTAEIDGWVAEFGERHRALIASAIQFLDEREPRWKLAEPVNRDEYVRAVVERQVETEP